MTAISHDNTERFEEPLSEERLGLLGWNIFFLTGPALMFSALGAILLRSLGYRRKFRDAMFAILMSNLVLYGTLFVGFWLRKLLS